mgnify:CR=1 FL=1
MKYSKEIKAGLIALVAFFALFWGVNFLKGSSIFEQDRNFYAVYGKVDGLMSSRPVNVNGFQVGRVGKIKFHPDGSGRLLVKILMDKDIPVPGDSKAKIYSSDLLGEKAIRLELGQSPDLAQPGDTLVSSTELSLTEEVNKQVAPIKRKAERLLGSIDTTLVLLQGFLNSETKKNFTQTFQSINRSFTSLEHSVKNFDTTLTYSKDELVSTVKNVEKVTSTFADNSGKIDTTIRNLNQISDSLAQIRIVETFSKLDRTLNKAESVLAKVDEGKGSAGKLINNPEVYDNLAKATNQLNLLLLDLKYNPQRYINISIFGNTANYSEEEILEMETAQDSSRKGKAD